MTKEDNEDFENSTKCWVCDNDYIDNDVKVRDHCHITRKYRGSAHRDCNINFKLTGNKISVKEYELVLKVWSKFEMNVERFSRFVFKM